MIVTVTVIVIVIVIVVVSALVEDDVQQGAGHEGLVHVERPVFVGENLGAGGEADHRRHEDRAHAGRGRDGTVPRLQQPPDEESNRDPVQAPRLG